MKCYLACVKGRRHAHVQLIRDCRAQHLVMKHHIVQHVTHTHTHTGRAHASWLGVQPTSRLDARVERRAGDESRICNRPSTLL